MACVPAVLHLNWPRAPGGPPRHHIHHLHAPRPLSTAINVCFVVCVSGDAASLSQENRALKAQLDRLMVERNDLRSQVGRVGSHTAAAAAVSASASSHARSPTGCPSQRDFPQLRRQNAAAAANTRFPLGFSVSQHLRGSMWWMGFLLVCSAGRGCRCLVSLVRVVCVALLGGVGVRVHSMCTRHCQALWTCCDR